MQPWWAEEIPKLFNGLFSYLSHAEPSPQAPPLLPASLCEHNKGAGAAFEGGLNSAHSYSIWRVTGQMGGAPQLLKQLPVERGCLCLAGDLTAPPGGGREGLHTIIRSITQTERNAERDTCTGMLMLVLYCSKAFKQSLI